MELPDIQSTADARQIAIQKVGVTSVQFPVQFASSPAAHPQSTVATFDLFVSLPENVRGTHMSRFLQAIGESVEPLNYASLMAFCQRLEQRLHAPSASLRVRFPYFVERAAPVSGQTAPLPLQVTIEIGSRPQQDLTLTVRGPATSLCPCSKEISDRGAHNQRCELSACVRFRPGMEISIEELFSMMEQAASTQVFPILKRPDEKWVTEQAFDHPKFVEDIVRDMAVALNADGRLAWYRCSSENFESIHQHNAYAEVESTRVDG